MSTTSGKSKILPSAATAAAVAALLIAALWLGSAAQPEHARQGPTAESLGDSSEVESWSNRADEIFAIWAGSPSEQQAAEVVAAHALNGGFSECMADRGYRRPWQASIYPPSVYEDPLLYSFWGAGRLDDYYAQKVINAEVGQRLEQAANAVEATGSEAEAETVCRELHPGASDEAVSQIRVPDVVRKLLEVWASDFQHVYAAGGGLDSYEACMRETGALQESGWESTSQAREWLSSPRPVGSIPLADEPSTPAWDRYLKVEQGFVDADWSCREPVRAHLGDEVTEALDSFMNENGDAIQLARNHWEEITKAATELGWSSSDPYAGTERRANP